MNRPANQPRPGEVPYKEWVTERAREAGLTVGGIQQRVARGTLKVKVRRVNKRVVFVKVGSGVWGLGSRAKTSRRQTQSARPHPRP